MNKILELKNVSYCYEKDIYILKDINISFEKGKVYAIKGRSGSGKSTLLSLISGLENKYEGEIYYKDKLLKSINLDNYRSHDIGIVFQSYNLLFHLTTLENIILSMDISKHKYNDKKEEALKLIEKVGLKSEYAGRRILKLSGGEQQRVSIARCLSYNPEVIIADEPTGNLDKETETEILKILEDLAHKENKCVIIVTHSSNVSSRADIVYDISKINNK